jgi:peptidoglycan/LPS O-acetylase OafA/YrhL
MSAKQTTTNVPLKQCHAIQLTGLTGIRFFAIFHIFCFHLSEIHRAKQEPQFAGLLSDMALLPNGLLTFLRNGWMSTSFFFLLSGFILAYLYWSKDGDLSTTRQRFWLNRASRLYPIHLILVIITALMMVPNQLMQGANPLNVIAGTLANFALVQAWNPNWVPMISWPTWTISALVFLYLCMPFLMAKLAKLSRKSSILLLLSLPVLSLIPTFIYAQYFPIGSEPEQFWQIFLGSTPLFWLAHFVAGMLLSRIFTISRFNPQFKPTKRWWALGDLAFVMVIALMLMPNIEEPFKYYLRHGLMMPLYLIMIYDLALGNGLVARFFSLPGMKFIGETGYSVFIWQNLLMVAMWVSLMINANAGEHHFLIGCIVMVALAIFSTYVIEKPLSRRIRKKWLKTETTK